ncbi:CHASE2 domain-containing protein [Polynucleobacter sp. JS-Fieb-80-E5]|uniref:CHASE2 domain-containing protein n=1 Tax=Polynucleobacter sp. JS-Fieb-80-E5 TaxID=2081050 RepID=UPI001C0E6B56|nr:adenylate/guanylate cyclase domain-containing protein [Polynucleobacter sp. JS-Fieb-80-E5]MBU3617845.1 adenylate/guanylate cyclase domain-containing protein [Polynucleobacter sp. JS-Fieb-80-E5]
MPSKSKEFLASFKKNIPRISISLFIAIVFACQAGGWLAIPIIDRFDGMIYDAHLRLTAPGGIDPRVVIVDIDEKSLREREAGGEGRWPWPRDRLALLISRLNDDYQVALTGFDVIFSERDESSGIRTMDRLAKNDLKNDAVFQLEYGRIKPLLDFDSQFASSFKDRITILAYNFLSPGDQSQKGTLPSEVFTTSQIPLNIAEPLIRQGFTGNLVQLQNSATDGGHINPIIDSDGIIRRIPMLIVHDGKYYESLALACVKALLGGLPLKALDANGKELTGVPNYFGAIEFLDIGGAILPVDSQLASYIPYRGPYKSFEYISASDVLNKSVAKEKLEGKIVLIGATAPGLLDLRVTPVGNAYPGAEIHANMIAGILDGTIKQAPLWTNAVNLALIAMLGIFLALILPWLSPLWGTITSIMALAAILGLNFFAYQKGILLPLASLLASSLGIYLFNITYGYFVEFKSKRLITSLFGQYVPPQFVDEMAQNPDNFSMESESRELTILFSDVRGFTTIAESLDAKTLSEFINAFLTPLTQVIYQHRGTIDKYMGDCIMAFWGAPIQDENHARQGVLSAFEMLKAVDLLNLEFVKRGWPPIKVGIGLNSGRVSVGNMGSQIRLAYTVMGDAVNLASRLEGIAGEYGVAIIIGDQTNQQIPDLISRELDKVKVKGKDIAVTIYEPLGFEGQVSAERLEALSLYDQALAAYRAQDWQSAREQFETLLHHHAHTGKVLYELYLERIMYLSQNSPGSHWDGSYTLAKK